jgi:Zn-dependent peptidase ImmA (M78 family)
MTDSNPMQDLYARLERAGIEKWYVREYVLPDWWDDEIAESSTGFLEAVGYIAKHLGIKPSDLRNEESSLSARDVAGARFKLRDGIHSDEVTWAQSIAVRAGEMAAYATPTSYHLSLDTTANSIRKDILENGAGWVSLENLLNLCWEVGVPVLHIPDVPGKKMDGIVVGTDDRPAIVLSIDHKHKAKLLFILAHELGHIFHGHVGEGNVVIDEEYTPDADDSQEQQANQFAVELIFGESDFAAGVRRYIEAAELAEIARKYGIENQISPGALVLNAAYHDSRIKNPWPRAHAALNKLDPDQDAPELIRSELRERLDWSLLPEESADFLTRVTGVDQNTEFVPAGH